MNRRASRILTVCAGAWLLVIWGHSCLPAAQSGAESGALLVVVQDLLPRMTDHVLRKCAHFAEYAVLGALTAAAHIDQRRAEGEPLPPLAEIAWLMPDAWMMRAERIRSRGRSRGP